jgi:hypothetical protein
MRKLKAALLLALVGFGLAGCVFEEDRGGPGWRGGYHHGWADRGSYDHRDWR